MGGGNEEGNKKGASEEELETNMVFMCWHLSPVCVFVFVLCEQMNLSGSDKVVIKNGISGSRFVVSSSETRDGCKGRREGQKKVKREVALCVGRKCKERSKGVSQERRL